MFCFDSSPDSVRTTFAFTKVWCVDGPYLLLLLSGPLRLPVHLGRYRTRYVCFCWSILRSGIVVTAASGVAAKSGCADSWYNHMATNRMRGHCYVLQSSTWRGDFLTAAACSAVTLFFYLLIGLPVSNLNSLYILSA